MKKSMRFLLLVTTFVLCMAFVSVDIVQADNSTGKRPWVHTYVESIYAKAKDVPIADLPGVYTNASGIFEPEGVALNEAQFGGSYGSTLTGMATGYTARACFDFASYRYGWEGAVYKYNGSVWVPLKTTIVTSYENPNIWACANYVSNGTYALVIHYPSTTNPSN